jgi:hypothetical protein
MDHQSFKEGVPAFFTARKLAGAFLLTLLATACSPAAPRPCKAGQTQPCGNCGTGAQACQNGAWGLCEGATGCAPGSMRGCGAGGGQTCLANCTWDGCQEQAACEPGEPQACAARAFSVGLRLHSKTPSSANATCNCAGR